MKVYGCQQKLTHHKHYHKHCKNQFIWDFWNFKGTSKDKFGISIKEF